jgi:hypothetical protein
MQPPLDQKEKREENPNRQERPDPVRRHLATILEI